MSKVTVNYRPDVDGYAFVNDWTADAVEKKEIRQIVEDCLPAAVGILTPIVLGLSPLVLATLGPILGILAAIPPFFAPLIVREILDKLVDLIADASMGRCDGMAYSEVDYHRLQWVVPRGGNLQPRHLQDGGTVASDSLRQYIWDRQLDAHRANAAKFLVWIAIDQFLGDFGKEWLRDRSREELASLKSKLSQGLPWPLGLVATAADPTKSHAVVAISYEEIATNRYRVEINDNNHPDELRVLDIDLSGTTPLIHESDEADPNNEPEDWAGLFCTDYHPKRPRPAVVAASPLTLAPPAFATENAPITATFAVLNQGFGTTLPFHFAVGKGSSDGEDTVDKPTLDEGQQTQPPRPFIFKLNQPITFQLQPMVALLPNSGPPSYKVLPTAGGLDVMPSIFIVNPRIPIHVVPQSTNDCALPNIEGNKIEFRADISPVAGIGVKGFQWRVSADSSFTPILSHDTNLTIDSLPVAGTQLIINLTVTLNDGTEATGIAKLTVVSAAMAQAYYRICGIAHIAARLPVLRVPLKPSTDPVPDWFNSPVTKRILDPQAIGRQYALAAKEIGKIQQQKLRDVAR